MQLVHQENCQEDHTFEKLYLVQYIVKLQELLIKKTIHKLVFGSFCFLNKEKNLMKKHKNKQLCD